MWITEEAVAAWQAPATGKRGGQPIYSAIAIETSLALRLVFHQPLRQTEGLLRSIANGHRQLERPRTQRDIRTKPDIPMAMPSGQRR